MHCASVNPNGEIIKKLIDNGGDFYSADSEGWQCIHYAAVCETPGPLKELIERGVQVDT